MAYTPREIKDRVAVGDDIFQVEDLGNNRIRLIPAPTHVSEPGTPINKALLQPIEDYLATGVVPVERTITVGDGLIGGGDLSADRTLKIDFATKSEAEAGVNNKKLMTPLRMAEAFNNRVVFAWVNEVVPIEGAAGGTVIKHASSRTDYNTIKFDTLLSASGNITRFGIGFSSLGDVVVGTPEYQLSQSPTPSPSLEFRLFNTQITTTMQGVSISHGITMFSSGGVEFLITRKSGTGTLNDIYLHFRFTGLKLA